MRQASKWDGLLDIDEPDTPAPSRSHRHAAAVSALIVAACLLASVSWWIWTQIAPATTAQTPEPAPTTPAPVSTTAIPAKTMTPTSLMTCPVCDRARIIAAPAPRTSIEGSSHPLKKLATPLVPFSTLSPSVLNAVRSVACQVIAIAPFVTARVPANVSSLRPLNVISTPFCTT